MSVPDQNGDGFAELLVGMSGHNNFRGMVRCISGRLIATGQGASVLWDVVPAVLPGAAFGSSIVEVATSTGSNATDFLIGAPGLVGPVSMAATGGLALRQRDHRLRHARVPFAVSRAAFERLHRQAQQTGLRSRRELERSAEGDRRRAIRRARRAAHQPNVGLALYSARANAAPFQGGVLCVKPPLRRSPVLAAGGSSSGADCSGACSYDLGARFAVGEHHRPVQRSADVDRAVTARRRPGS